jgi:hypothetical protein
VGGGVDVGAGSGIGWLVGKSSHPASAIDSATKIPRVRVRMERV